jgi:hypothetical protein
MPLLLATSSVSLVESLRLALEAEGIQAAVTNELMAPFQPIKVEVRDEDYERAKAVLADLQVT